MEFAGCGADHAADRIAMSDRPTRAIVDLGAVRHNIGVARKHVGLHERKGGRAGERAAEAASLARRGVAAEEAA